MDDTSVSHQALCVGSYSGSSSREEVAGGGLQKEEVRL